jgi:membrane fusion protein, copper/silver efflux system
MKKLARVLVFLFVLCVSFASGILFNQRYGAKRQTVGGRKVLYYVDPMHPAYKSSKPGIAPDCGMKLEPVYEDDSAVKTGASDTHSSMPAGSIQITPEKQQLIGLRVIEAGNGSESGRLRTTGRVTLDESLVYQVTSGIEGWVRDTTAVVPGSFVHKDEVLGTVYNKDVLTAQQQYVNYHQPKILEDSLLALGMSQAQVDELARTGSASGDIQLRSPVDGVVVARNVRPGSRIDKGADLFRVAKLSRMWILADVFEGEAQHLRPGTVVRVGIAGETATRHAKVDASLPQFDPATRTLKLRLIADNADLRLRPDMFVDVELPVELPRGLTVPSDAVMDTGLRKRVYVDRGNGFFEPREVETGWRYGDKVQIVSGLRAGERVVDSGTFLVDSESRLKLASMGISATAAAVKDAVCGMDIDQAKAETSGHKSQIGGHTYYFCSDSCKRKFDQDPDRYMHALKESAAGASR